MISIIVDNYNRSYLLPLVMQAYSVEDFDGEAEMIIIDDVSDPRDHFIDYLIFGLDTIKPWFKVRAFQTHVSTHKNTGKTLNIGVKQSRGDVIIFNHTDMIPLQPNTLELVRKAHHETDWLYLTPSFLSSRPRKGLPPDKLGLIGFTLPAGASMRRKLFDKAGGFDERFMGYGPVDTDLAQRIYYGQGDMGWVHRKSDEIIYLHLEMAQIPVRSGEPNPRNAELLRENMQAGRWAVNPDGWGECDTLEEVQL